jgi:uncharacterized protein YjbI with pentapeptide repeats
MVRAEQFLSTSQMKKQDSRDYKPRWRGAGGQQLAREVWKRLAAGASLHDLGLGEHQGRIDLRGLMAPEVNKEELPPFRNWGLHRLTGYLELKNIQLEGMDFSDAMLAHMRFFHARIANCKFDHADCRDWKVRATDVTGTSFVRSNLRNAALGTWYAGRGNRYEFVDFSRAEMRGLLSSTATYADCDFSNARLDKIDFQSSSFIRCRFAGEVREVLFYDHAYKTSKEELNRMEDVDFSKAQLRWVEFRHLDLDRVRFPEDDNHILLKNYGCVLRKALIAAKKSRHPSSRGFAAVLQNRLKWIGPKQGIGIINRLDFRDSGGLEGQGASGMPAAPGRAGVLKAPVIGLEVTKNLALFSTFLKVQ